MSLLKTAVEEGSDSFVVMGQSFTVRVAPEQTGGACLGFDCRAEPGMGVPTHVHDHEDELFYIRRGRGRFVVDGRELIVGPGGTAFGPRGVPHSWEAIGDETLEAFLLITPGNLEAMFRELAAMTQPDFAKIAAICAPHGIRFA